MRILAKLLTGALLVATLVACGATDPEGVSFEVKVHNGIEEEGFDLSFREPGDRALLRASTIDQGSEERIDRTEDAIWTVRTMHADATYDASEVVQLEAFDEASGFRPLLALVIPDGEDAGEIEICAAYEQFAEECVGIIVTLFNDN